MTCHPIRAARQRGGARRTAAGLALLASLVALAGCPLDKVPDPKVVPAPGAQ